MTFEEEPPDLTPALVVDIAPQEVTSLDQLPKDRQKARYAYKAIAMRGSWGDGSDRPAGRFLATPDGEIFVFHDGVWLGEPDGEQRLRELGLLALGDAYGRNVFRELKEQVRSTDTVPRPTLGVPAGTVPTPEGLVCLKADAEHDLQPGEERPLRPEDHALGKITVAPDMDAPIEGSRWWEFIEESVPDAEERAKLQEYAGYTLLPGQPFKKALFLVGPTDSGKGTFLKAIEAVLGSDNVAHQSLQKLINSRWGTDKIYGKMANMANEVSPGAVKRVERFKELTGGEDTVTAERKGQPTYEFTVTQKFLFATNQFPSVSHADEAFWNRCLFVEFPNTVPTADQDPDLLDDLRGERATILNWMLDGLTRLLDRGHFTGERDIDERRALTKSFGSPVEQFVFEAVDVTGDPQDVIHQGDLYEAFTRFCHFQEFNETPVKQTFTKRLSRRPGVSSGRSRRVDGDDEKPHVYQGLRPVPETYKRIQADTPRHAVAEDAGQRDQQAFLGGRT